MDKLDTETWDKYALRCNLYKVIYLLSDPSNSVIDDVMIPTNDRITPSWYNKDHYYSIVKGYPYYGRISFTEIIMYEICVLRDKYDLQQYNATVYKDTTIVKRLTDEVFEEDFKRQRWLCKNLDWWHKKYLENEEMIRAENEQTLETNKTRFLELKTKIAETHKDNLEEILALYSPSYKKFYLGLEGNPYNNDVIKERSKNDEKDREYKRTTEKRERIEVYQKYLKNQELNKEINKEIAELEQRINNLKRKLV